MMKVVGLVDDKTSKMEEIPKPQLAADNQVLVKVTYAAIDTFLHDIATRSYGGSLGHNLKVSPLVPGNHFCGIIEEVRAAAPDANGDFQVGDVVFGHLQYESTTVQGSCSEYLVIPTTDLAKVPSKVHQDVAAASATEATTALQALRDKGELQEGDSVLIIAAGGGVGSLAVGMAKKLQPGVTVSAVCSTKDVDKVKSLGADTVIDRRQVSVEELSSSKDPKYNLILDASGKYGFGALRQLLHPGGRMVSVLPSISAIMFGSWLFPLLFQRSFKFVLCHSKKEDLELVAGWLESGAIKVSIDSTHNVSDFAKAWERQNDSGKTGRVVIKVDGGW